MFGLIQEKKFQAFSSKETGKLEAIGRLEKSA